jgi:acyl-CoA thioester hydrolase
MVMNWMSLPITQRAVIPESYLDEMGHMNVMWYTHLFSKAMGEVFQLVGMTRDYFLTNQAGAFALKQFVSYLAEVRLGESVLIRSRILGRSAKRIHVMHFLIKEESQVLAATAELLGAHVDMRIRRMAPYPPALAEKIDRFIAEHAALNWDPPVCGVIKA